MRCKLVSFICILFLSFVVNANELNFQIVEKEFSLTPEFVAQVQKSKTDANVLGIKLTDKGRDALNHFFINTYDKKLNIIFNGEPIQLSTMIKNTEYTNVFYLSAPDQKIRNQLYDYFIKKM